MKLMVRLNEVLLIQMQPNFITHLELVWNPMMIMSLLLINVQVELLQVCGPFMMAVTL